MCDLIANKWILFYNRWRFEFSFENKVEEKVMPQTNIVWIRAEWFRVV